MKEIKLIVSQEKFEENRKNQLLKDATKKNYKRQEKVVSIAKQTIAIGLLFMLIVWGLCLGQNLKNKGYNNCINNGYSESYCLKNS